MLISVSPKKAFNINQTLAVRSGGIRERLLAASGVRNGAITRPSAIQHTVVKSRKLDLSTHGGGCC
jgi:hypothetical protein